ncbi:MAG: DnaJ domain-containing protein [Pseudomonadota bacterium]
MILLFLPLILGVLAVFLTPLALRWYAHADPRQLAQVARVIGGALVILVAVGLVAAGAFVPAGLLSALGLWLMRMGRRGPAWGSAGGSKRQGQRSRVRTARLEATLDHDSGDMDAEVLAGLHEGRRFSDMGDGELFDLWADCGDDSESRLIVEAYLDRRRPDWRDDVEGDAHSGSAGSGGASSGGAMTQDDAYEILGLSRGASEEEIRASHRRLMKQVHPDQGGSSFLAAKLNEAKDKLLGKR